MKAFLSLVLIAFGMVLAGCDSLTGTDHVENYVVESYQIAGKPLAPVYLSRTAALDATYSFANFAIAGATVRIQLLAPDGSVEKTYPCTETSKGVYDPATSDLVSGGRRYRLEISADENTISGETEVPTSFALQNVSADTVVYRGPEQLTVQIERGTSNAPHPVYYIVNEALEPNEPNLLPFARELFEDDDVELTDIAKVGTMLNEANFDETSGGGLELVMPWLTFYFHGRQQVTIMLIDNNMYDFVRSQSVQSGGSTLSPGELPPLKTHLNGATGIFGSYAQVTYDYALAPNPDPF